MAAPMATTSSGFTPLLGSRPKRSLTMLDLGHARHATDEQDFGDFTVPMPASFKQFLHGCLALEETAHEVFELGAREGQRHVLRTRGIGSDERQVDVRALRGRQFNLRLFSGLRRRCTASLSCLRSMPCSFLKFSTK